MRIPAATLLAQGRSALDRWPWIPEVEGRYGLPQWLLLAVGSRETNLGVQYTQGATGDGGHGHGVWQLDDRFHEIPVGFDKNPSLQAEKAADLLNRLIARYPDALRAAMAAYNAGAGSVDKQLRRGRDPDAVTTGGDYGADVLERLAYLQANIEVAAPAPGVAAHASFTEEMGDMIATDPTNGDYWVLTGPEGGVEAYNANGTRGPRFYGDLTQHPRFSAGPATPNGPAVAISYWVGTLGGPGYVIYTRDSAGAVHPYHFDATTKKVNR